MEKRSILLKYGELILKGDNKGFFEAALLRQIRKKLQPIGKFRVFTAQSTVFVESEDDLLLEEALPRLRTVFGIVSISIAYRVEKEMDAILSVVREKIAPTLVGKRSFKADARRSDKKFPLKSPEICREVGGCVLSAMGKHAPKVDVHTPEEVVWVEIREDFAYVHAGKIPGAGGMPYGTAGRALLMLSGGIDSPVAGFRMAKRGAFIDALHFESFPYTSERAKEKVIDLARKLCEYTETVNFASIRLTEIQLRMQEACREEYFTILLRRSMMRLACRVAKRQKCGAIVTGESLGQVASQTMDALRCTDAAATLPVYRPLIGMDKEEIVSLSRAIDCFETSILPYEDCCTVFTPRHPKLNPTLEAILEEEAKLPLAELEDKAFGEIEFIRVDRSEV
ncbi:MAG: tRNA 4-thiouridine(8) synthase ThiI [Clostridia bacterium]|nr:tRNA 4-thiouridine(8) synthase ThiI [Clostridia bacterium]